MLRPYMRAIRHPKHNVRVADVRFPKHPAPAVARALSLGARGRFEVVDESPYDTTLDQSGAARRDTFVIDGTRGRPARRERIVDDRKPRIEQQLPDFPRQRRAALEHRFPRE